MWFLHLFLQKRAENHVATAKKLCGPVGRSMLTRMKLLGEGSSEEQAEMKVVSAHFIIIIIIIIIINIIIMSHDS